MCDCYVTECQKCDREIPVHIGDFKYPRSSVQVFCSAHLPTQRVTIFELTEVEWDEDEKYPVGWKCGIRLCEGTIEAESEDVYPNLGACSKITLLYCHDKKRGDLKRDRKGE